MVTAHEAAHQWWGNLLLAGEGPGADVLIEGAAHYSTLLLLEAERAAAARTVFARHLEQRYLNQRRIDGEQSLLSVVDRGKASDESLIYDKGGWALWMLHQRLGDARARAGMQAFFREFVGKEENPALHDLLAAMRLQAPDGVEFDRFVADWFAGKGAARIRHRPRPADAHRRHLDAVGTSAQFRQHRRRDRSSGDQRKRRPCPGPDQPTCRRRAPTDLAAAESTAAHRRRSRCARAATKPRPGCARSLRIRWASKSIFFASSEVAAAGDGMAFEQVPARSQKHFRQQ